MNKLDYEQKGDSRKLKSRFTNEVGSVFAEAFGIMLGGNVQSRRIQNPFAGGSSFIKVNPTAKSSSRELTNISDAEYATIDADTGHSDVLPRYFRLEDNKLKLVNSRVKHSGKLDQSIRIAILTLYAYECADHAEVEKSVLSELLNSTKLYDTHFQGWLAKCDEIVKSSSKLQLSVPGREIALEILKEIADDSVIKGSIAFSKTSRGGRRTKRKQTNDSASGVEQKAKSSNPRKKGAAYYFGVLIDEGYFGQKRKI
ncbi:hypothetical protein [Dyadobacter sp. OTU695]|uniref:hypothetical protein n=1 Tax=Dyadobacter sp. OTU695 TaxID=3043860 RepID=UPI00313A908D